MKKGTQLVEPKMVITIMIVSIAILSWYVVIQLVDSSSIDQIFIANQVRYIVYSVASFPFDQNVSFDLSDTRNYTISLVDDKVGIIESGYLTFSYSTKMNIPEHISVVGTATNFSRLCITRESNLIQLMECES